jgi:hypothetical protein
MSDIVSGLRRLPEPQCSPCYDAADEIERLGRLVRLQDAEIERLRLTDEERHAIAVVRNCAMTRAERFLTQSDAEREATLVLWRLRERLG